MYRGKEKWTPAPTYHEPDTAKPRTNTLRSQDVKVVACIFASWCILVHFIERVHVSYIIKKCRWRNLGGHPESHHVAIIADPQLVDGNSYPDRPEFINYFIRRLSDNYLHRNFRFTQYLLDPHTILFLGDLFDGGREWDDELWFQEFLRFTKVFPKEPNRRTIESIPGNHDIGFETIDMEKVKRFSAFFGPSNDFIEIGNHSVILLDTISLSSDDPVIREPAEQFLNTINEYLTPNFPRVLLTHVPLYKTNVQQVCGPLRESQNPFPIQKGKQYQTVLSPSITEHILKTLKPILIFSGDDHDYCRINHELDDGSVAEEITVKSAAMTAGIKYPAIQLLSLLDQGQLSPTYHTDICFMPSPYQDLTVYIIWFTICILGLALNFLFPHLLDKFKPNTLPVFVSKETRRQRNFIGFLGSGVLFVLFSFYTLHFYYRSV